MSRAALAVAGLLFCGVPSLAFAYRPFISTDADVASVRELEIELGLTGFGRSREGGSRQLVAPALILNYGFVRNWELVGEFKLQHRDEGTAFQDVAVFLKGVLREGELQDRSGTSIAVEVGPLLPGTGESGVGVEGILLLSRADAGFVYHLNAGAVRERSGAAGVLWGAILERPVREGLRLVVEVEGEKVEGASHESSLLGGFIWEHRNVGFDAGVRRRLSGDSRDWALTGGITFSL